MIISIEELKKRNLENKIIIMPTDTVYGIGCLLNDLAMVDRIYQIKERDYSKPFAILVSSIEQAKTLSADLLEYTKFIDEYWPGALTIVCHKTDLVDPLISSGLDTVGIRMPNQPQILSLLEHFGPMVVTSLNISTQPAITKFQDTTPFHSQVDYVIDGGDLSHSASTVIDIARKKILRQGELHVDFSLLDKK